MEITGSGFGAQVSPVIRTVGCFFNEPVPATSLAAVGVEGKGGGTSLHPAWPQACLSLNSHHARVTSREAMPHT